MTMVRSHLIDNVLDLADQTVFLGEQATGATSLLQCAWLYERGADIDGLLRFHGHLQKGRLSRRVERSPLPFGRHRWVTPSDSYRTEYGMEIVATTRPRVDFDAWLNEQASIPLDYEHGPGWHLAVLPFTDGGTGVSLALSHGLADGVGLCQALADAACGRHDTINWPPAASRRRSRAIYQDARQAARDTPAIGRAVVTAARMARAARRDLRAAGKAGMRTRAPKPIGTADRITVPTATVFVDVSQWDSRAQALGGTSNSLLVGVAAKLAQHVGRVSVDAGAVTMAIPVDLRTEGDTRANAVTSIDVVVDPTQATADLRDVRADVRAALIGLHELPDERFALLPLIPVLPRWVLRRMVTVAAGAPTTVCSSNIGDIAPAANRPDGTDADFFSMRTRYPGVTKATMHRAGGVLALLSGRLNGRVFVSALSYQPGRSNESVREALLSALADFSLTATAPWGCPEPAAR